MLEFAIWISCGMVGMIFFFLAKRWKEKDNLGVAWRFALVGLLGPISLIVGFVALAIVDDEQELGEAKNGPGRG